MKTKYHNPVLLDESVAALMLKPNGVYVDVTFGGGGHSKRILEELGEKGKLFAFDTDVEALQNTIDDPRFVLIQENFKHLKRFLRLYGIKKVDGILADLGVSSHQFDQADRGFSTRFEGELDMRMNRSSKLSALIVLNDYDEEKLATILFQYGELRMSRGIAKSIVEARAEKPIKTTFDLKKAISQFLPIGRENKIMAQVFQAIRIEVNQELEVLKDFLNQVPNLLNPEGRLSVISYHSLEDRLVKRFIRNGLFEGEPERDMYGNFEVPLQKVGKLIVPTREEIKQNNRARSAKLRIATLKK
ncbi:MAG TPA: 16S rRNA (cytosine(1402)-N(4))-methyltransferase RsmH [Lutibacter sp.]|nr:16S rRNA (cytosine(1402)-N(4))-methyltransferase RsmH [Lutibacter sp.]